MENISKGLDQAQ